MRIIGKVLDEKYTKMLMLRTDLNLTDVIALDKVQKGKPLNDREFQSLKRKHLIEGRRPRLFVSAEVAAVTDTKADYIKKRAFSKDYYKSMIKDYLTKFKEASRHDIDELLMDIISDALTEEQKKTQITNLLQEMRREGVIKPIGATRHAKWVLSK
ncbi:MAG: hypothetical protein GKC10_09040 [Methanosarcinales archaeon]|nr:hypothetical protein [Methanosarcinales archaeon]